jgi:hypothetical protein
VALPLSYSNNGALTAYEWNNDQGYLGYNLIKYVELDIGGQVVDRLYSEFMVLWSQLTMDYLQRTKLNQMVSGPCKNPNGASVLKYGTKCAEDGRPQHLNVLYIPLPFFFTRNPGAALPLIALQYHEVKINVLWNDPKDIAGDFRSPQLARLPQAIQAALYIDYIYLDTEERRRMAQASHEYLIEQTQYNEDKGIIGVNNRIDLTFNHPVKELIWVVQPSSYTDCRLAAEAGLSILKPFTYDIDPVFDQLLQINGQDRLDRRYGDYFNKVQTFQHHTGTLYTSPGAYIYSFALRPEEHQPSGTCNFSRIDTATIVMNMAGDGEGDSTPVKDEYNNSEFGKNGRDWTNNWDVRVYAVNYNVLRVMSGMGGLAYSN